MEKIIKSKIGTDYLADNARQDGYAVFCLDDNTIPNVDFVGSDDYVIFDGKTALLMQFDAQPVLVDVLTAKEVYEAYEYGDEFAKWMVGRLIPAKELEI